LAYKSIIYEESGGIARVTLNRPEKMNSLDEVLIVELTQLFVDLNSNENVRSVILTGAGGNFCSGLYLDYLQKISQFDLSENKADSHRFKDMLLAIYNCSKPVIAKVSGFALAGGCGIAACSDIIVADETAKLGYTEVKIGFIPAIVMVFLLKRISETHARDLLLTSRIIGADEAQRIGLVNYSVRQNELDIKVQEICEMLGKNSANSISLTKEMLRKVPGMNFDEALEYACELNAQTRMTDDCKSGVKKFLERDKQT
jgi:methylglutaconyl-CoA hydratase